MSEGAGPSRSGPKWANVESSGIDSLPPDLQDRILQLGWLPFNPLYDRGDALRDAAALACVGNAACTELAGRLFAALSPRLGQELPDGVTEGSPVAALKAACKAWGLPIGGTKSALWQRLLNEVQDSEEGERGEVPKHCIVSGATRAELTGWSQARISFRKAKEVFHVWKHEIESCRFVLDPSGPGAKPGAPAKSYLLADVKRIARRRHSSWESLTGQKQREREQLQRWQQEYDAARQRRISDLRDELSRRGYTVAQMDEMLSRSPGAGYVTWGSGEKVAAAQAVDYLERMHYCVSSPGGEVLFSWRFACCDFQPPRSMSQYKVKERRLELAASAVLRDHARCYSTLEELRGDPGVPASLLLELERLWRERYGT